MRSRSKSSSGGGNSDAIRPRTATTAAEAAPLGQSICTFWLGGRCFGLDVSLVGEVVAIEGVCPVPASHKSLVGLFNLRGTPLALIEVSDLLGVEVNERNRGQTTALVLRAENARVGLAIDRMDAVIPRGRAVFVPPEIGTERALVEGFLETSGDKRGVVTLLGTTPLLEAIEQMKYLRAQDG